MVQLLTAPARYEPFTSTPSSAKPGMPKNSCADDAVPTLGRLDKDAVFLQKPFTGERLIKKVHEVLER